MMKPWWLLCTTGTIVYGIAIYNMNQVMSLQFMEMKKTYHSPPLPVAVSRRRVLNHIGWLVSSTSSSISSIAVLTQHPDSVMAAIPPITLKETETGMAKMMRVIRPKPPKLLRPKINLNFAVLFMRTSYSIIDELDIIPMNQFQRDFFFIRTSEYESYIQSLGPGYVTQGDLTDPSYFDFISFAQYVTINRVLSDPATIFEELQPITTTEEEEQEESKTTTATTTTTTTLTHSNNASNTDQSTIPVVLQRFQPVIVRRTINNDQLVPTFQKKFGTTILQYFDDTYTNTLPIIPITTTIHNHQQRPSMDEIQASLTQIIKLFLINGFAWDGRVEVIASPPSLITKTTTTNNNNNNSVTFRMILDSPASLWGNGSLHQQRAILTNDYLLYVTREFIQERTGYTVVSSYVKFQDNSEITYLQIQ